MASPLAPGIHVSKGATNKNGFQSESRSSFPHGKQKLLVWTHTKGTLKITIRTNL